MQLHKNNFFTIYFGDARTPVCSIQDIRAAHLPAAHESLKRKILQQLQDLPRYNLPKSIFIHQTHGTDGIIVSDNQMFDPFTHQGDFLITNQPNIPLGILTADCLPVILYDPVNHAIAIAHAGWKGSLAGIVTVVIDKLTSTFAMQLENLQVFLGPSAHACCYEVSPDFGEQAHKPAILKKSIVSRGNKVFFDNLCYTYNVLNEAGILPENVSMVYASCTICNLSFCSYRRDKEQSGLQPTIVVLHK